MSNGKEEPSAFMRGEARLMRDQYVALTAEGFDSQEAMMFITMAYFQRRQEEKDV